MLSQFIQAFSQAVTAFQANSPFVLLLIGIAVIIQLVNAATGYRLNRLGIIPRRPRGLLGIAFSPVLHGNFNHLFSNALPFFVLVNLCLLFGHTFFYHLSLYLILLSGTLLWLFGRPAVHIGASTLIMGYLGFLLMDSYFNPTNLLLVLMLVTLYYFGSLLLSVLPGRKGISWEGHLFGLVSGLSAAFFF